MKSSGFLIKDYWKIGWTGPKMELDVGSDFEGNNIVDYYRYNLSKYATRYTCFMCGKRGEPSGKDFVPLALSLPKSNSFNITEKNVFLEHEDIITILESDMIAMRQFQKIFLKSAQSSYITHRSSDAQCIMICKRCFIHPEWWGELKMAKLKLDTDLEYYTGGTGSIVKDLQEYKKSLFGEVVLEYKNLENNIFDKIKRPDDHSIIKQLLRNFLVRRENVENKYRIIPSHLHKDSLIPYSVQHISAINGVFEFGIKGKEFLGKLIESQSMRAASVNLSLFNEQNKDNNISDETIDKIEDLVNIKNALKENNYMALKNNPFSHLYLLLLIKNDEKQIICGYDTKQIILELLNFMNLEPIKLNYKEHKFDEDKIKNRLGDKKNVIGQ